MVSFPQASPPKLGDYIFIINVNRSWLYLGDSSPDDYHLFPALKQNIGSCRFKDDGEVETVVI
jgi:hypothetical protein